MTEPSGKTATMWFKTLLFLVFMSSTLGLHMKEPPVPKTSRMSVRNPTEHWFTARLDHFDASNTDNFQMRFYYNNEFNATDHILIFVGGEWAISPGWLQGGLMHEIAAEVRAAMFYTEHRYYGQTRPTDDTRVENLRYLTVDQSLADLAQFIEYIKSDRFECGKFRNATVGLVGCSYAGSMATWMRLAYPHLVDVAFSDSGPLHAQEDFPEYLDVITSALRSQGSDQCVSSIQEAMDSLIALLQTQNGPQQVSEIFNTCTTIAVTAPLDLATFFWVGITETFAYLVQYATPGDIPAACAVLTDTNIPNPTQRLANFITSQAWAQPCIETRYTEFVTGHTNTNYDAYDSVMRLWTYQTCVEYGWYQTTTSKNQPFLSTVPLEYFHQMCKDFFSENLDEELLRSGIERTNVLFAGLSFMPDYVVSVAGTGDPWSPMGPNESHATARAPVYVVPDVSHCRAIQATASSETEALEEVKERVKSFISARLTGIPLVDEAENNAVAARATTLLFALFALVVVAMS